MRPWRRAQGYAVGLSLHEGGVWCECETCCTMSVSRAGASGVQSRASVWRVYGCAGVVGWRPAKWLAVMFGALKLSASLARAAASALLLRFAHGHLENSPHQSTTPPHVASTLAHRSSSALPFPRVVLVIASAVEPFPLRVHPAVTTVANSVVGLAREPISPWQGNSSRSSTPSSP
jgi:hypothetical protein